MEVREDAAGHGGQSASTGLVVATVFVVVVGMLVLASAWGLGESLPAPAATAVDVSHERTNLDPAARIFADARGELTAQGLVAGAASLHSIRGSDLASLGVGQPPHWFLVTLDNPTPAPVDRLLVFDPSWLDDIRATLIRPDGTALEQRGGDHYDFDIRPIPHRKVIFPLQLPPGRSQLAVRVETIGPCVVGMTLWASSAFFRSENAESAYVGVVGGTLGAMLLFNLVLYLSLRDRVYAAYVLYLLSFMLTYAAYNDYLVRWLWPHQPYLADWSKSALISLFAAAGLQFALRFLDLRQRLPRLVAAGRIMMGGILVTLVIETAISGFQWINSSLVWVLITAPFTLVMGLAALLNGVRAARYYVPATTAGFIGTVFAALAVSGHVQFSFVAYHAVETGMVVDAILLSFALADRLRLANMAADQARAELLQATRSYALQLEHEVEQRTRELRASNAAKDRFFSIIAHDLRGPIRSLGLLYSEVIQSPREFTAEILELTRDATSSTGELLEQLLLWARSQRGEIEYDPHIVNLGTLLQETQRLYGSQAAAKGVVLHLEAGEGCLVYADQEMVKTILRNLVSNALKFTGAGGRVTARVTQEGNRCAVQISDTGCGISAEEQRLLFPDDHSLPAPTVNSPRGLGLILCREFVERHGGTIRVNSRPGEGASFTFTLLRAAADVRRLPGRATLDA